MQEQILKIFIMQEKQLLKSRYTSRASEARRKAKKGTGLKILTQKQMLQRLSVAIVLILRVYQMRSDRLSTLCIDQKKLLKKYIIT